MKIRMTVGLGILIFGLGTKPGSANPIAENPIFEAMAGEWTGQGKLLDQQGNETSVAETWRGKFTETGNFIISGIRKLGQAEHEFAWEFYTNQDIIEGQMKISEPRVDRRFEVAVNEEARSIVITVPLGGGSTMKIVNTVAKDGKSILGTVELADQSGQITSRGKVEHAKKES